MNTLEQSISRHQGSDYLPFALPAHRGTRFLETELSEIKLLLSQLTQRQQEILQKIVEGVPNKVIAMDLRISQRTVEKHREGIMQKMRVRSLAVLVRTIVLYEAYTTAAESVSVVSQYGTRNQ